MQRKEKRAVRPGSRAVCYTTLQHGSSLPVGDQPEPQNADFKAVQQRLLTFSTPSAVCKSTEASRFRDMDPTHLSELMLVPSSPASRQQMGLKVPAMSRLKPPQLIEHLGFRTEAAIAAGDGREDAPRWNLLQWLQYWSTRQLPKTDGGSPGFERTKSVDSIEDEADSRDVRRREWEGYMRSVDLPKNIAKGISAEARRRPLSMTVSLSGSSMEDEFAAPSIVVEHDLAERHWPAQKGSAEPRNPRPIMQLHMAPAGAFLNFTIAPGGASTWVHVVSGRKVFILMPNIPTNLSAYASWHGTAREAGGFLPEHTSEAERVPVEAGSTLFIPVGWVYAEVATEDTLALRGLSLQLQSVQAHLEAARLEEYLDLRPSLRFPHFYEVLWHTAAAISENLVQAAGLPAKMLCEQTAELAADRLRRQQRMIPVPAQHEPTSGTDSDDDFGRPRPARLRKAQAPEEARTGFVIKEGSSRGDEDHHDKALQRPMKRLKRLGTPQYTELAADLEDDVQDDITLEDDADEDFDAGSPPSVNPPRIAARAPKQATETVYYSDSPEEEEDEELRAMQNIRNRGRRQHDVGGQELLPKVKLRSGLRDRRASSLKVRLKASEPDMAKGSLRGRAATGSGHAGQQLPARLTVKLGGSQPQSPPEAGARQLDTVQRTPSLRVKLRVNSLEHRIPQLDGSADGEGDNTILPPEQSKADPPPDGAADSDDNMDGPAQHSGAAAGQHHNGHEEAHEESRPALGPQQLQEPWGPESPPQHPMPGGAPVNDVPAAHTADFEERPSAEPALPAGADLAQAEPPPSTAEIVRDVSQPEQSSSQPARDRDLAASKLSLSNGPVPGQTKSGLTNDELAALPILVSALRGWLDAQAGRIPGIGDQEDAQEALDRMVVCLRALGKPGAPIKYAVDFSNLPSVPVPSPQPAPARAAPSDAEDSGAPADGLPSADEADDTAPEELGDSVHEAQSRAARKGGRGGSAGRVTKKKPTIKDRLAKKLRLG